ncbi:MAG TPA: hypothetical protein VE862_05505 [Candidatus Acidoferrum sp.]|nr:hypothetical protein [Candidatus Acidoferrum sp.]
MPIILVALALAVFLSGHIVSAQLPSSYAKITDVSAPSGVKLGQSLIVSVTVSYSFNLNAGQSLFIAIRDHTENGNPFPATAISSSCSNPAGQAISVCFASISNSSCVEYCSGNFIASFTITAPNLTEVWSLFVFAQIIQINRPGPGLNSTPPVYYDVVTEDLKLVHVTIT